jgi:hypothetical protein
MGKKCPTRNSFPSVTFVTLPLWIAFPSPYSGMSHVG